MAKREIGRKNTGFYKNLFLTAAEKENKSPGIYNPRRFLYSKFAL
jgi:hypothetical protein